MTTYRNLELDYRLELYADTAIGTTVVNGGYLEVNSSSVASNTTVDSGGSMFIYDHGLAKNTTINNGGHVEVAKADIEDTVINSGGRLDCYHYTIKRTQVNSGGYLNIDMAKEANSITVNREGYAHLGAEDDLLTLTGVNIFGGTISTLNSKIDVKNEIVFAINQHITEDGVIVDDLSAFRNGTYSVSVSNDQAAGRYRIANNAGSFADVILIKDTSLNKKGTLQIGKSISVLGATYELLIVNNTLVLDVSRNAVTDTQSPTTPGGLTQSVSGKSVSLDWNDSTDNVGVSGYELRYGNSKTLSSVAAIIVSASQYSLGNFSDGNWYWQVRAFDAVGNYSGWSNVQSFTVGDSIAPKLGKLSAMVSGYDVTLSLNAIDNVGVERYVVTCGNKQVETTTNTAVLESFGIGKFTASVVAYDAASNASKMGKVTFTIKDATPPDTVTGLRVDGDITNNKGGTLAWSVPYDNSGSVVSYEIYVDGKLYKSSKNTLKVSKLAAGVHSFTVIAIDKEKNRSAVSEAVSFEVLDGVAPKMGKITATVNGYSATLSWSATDDVGVARYVVKGGDQEFETVNASATLSDLTVGKYKVEVTAYDAAGNASKAGSVSITVKDATPPEQVTGLRADGIVTNQKGGMLTWDIPYDNSGKVASYEIVINGKTYKSNKNTLKIGKLAAGTYSFTAIAIDKEKNRSVISEAGEFTVADIIAPKISSLKSKVSYQTATLNWAASDDSGVISHSEVWLNGALFHSGTGTTLELDGLNLGKHAVELRVYDEADNMTSKKLTVNIKQADPVAAAMALTSAELCATAGVDNIYESTTYKNAILA